jgi:biotin synthase-like enzyme
LAQGRPPLDIVNDKTGVCDAQCKGCATAEERRRREERDARLAQEAAAAAAAAAAGAQAKRCSRCGADKPASDFCRNKRSFDGLYSQCRACVSSKVAKSLMFLTRRGR